MFKVFYLSGELAREVGKSFSLPLAPMHKKGKYRGRRRRKRRSVARESANLTCLKEFSPLGRIKGGTDDGGDEEEERRKLCMVAEEKDGRRRKSLEANFPTWDQKKEKKGEKAATKTCLNKKKEEGRVGSKREGKKSFKSFPRT